MLLVSEETTTPQVERSQKKESPSQYSRRMREALQAFLQDVIQPDLRAFTLCRKAPIAFGDGAVIRHNKTQGRASWSGLHTCKNYNCPTCGPRRRYVLQRDCQRVLDKHSDNGGSQIAVHFTTDDNAFEDLDEAISFISKCWNRMFSGRFGQMLQDKYGKDGYFRAIESTININRRGHHPHIHGIITFSKRLSQFQLDTLTRLLIDKWCQLVSNQSNGKNQPYKSLQKVHLVYSSNMTKDYGSEISRYLTKVCSGISTELTHSQHKLAKHQGSYGLFEAVQAMMELEPTDYQYHLFKALIREHLEASKGKRLFSYSRDFFKRYDLEETPEDEIFDEDEEADEVITLDVRQTLYNALNNYKQLSNILMIVEEDGERMDAFLEMQERCSNFEDACRNAQHRDGWGIINICKEKGISIEEAWTQNEQETVETINRFCDAAVYWFVRDYIQQTGSIKVRWFKDYHSQLTGVQSRQSYLQ